MDFFDTGKLCGEGAEDVRRCRREKQTEAGADEGQEKSFGEQLSDECAARSTQGEADRDFVLTLSRARQEQSHDVGTRDEQQQSDGAKEQPEGAARIADGGFLEARACATVTLGLRRPMTVNQLFWRGGP